MRGDVEKFRQRGAQVVAIAPDTKAGVERFTKGEPWPFPLLADETHQVFDAYDVVSRMLSLGQRPAVFVVDREGIVRFDAIGVQQWEIPANDEVLAVLDGLTG